MLFISQVAIRDKKVRFLVGSWAQLDFVSDPFIGVVVTDIP
jgi:hypothetical protein